MGSHHAIRFPGESDEYRRARDELLEAEVHLRRQEEAVAQRRRALPLGGAITTDYEFDEWDAQANAPRRVRISELLADGTNTLLLYSFMWVPESQDVPFVGPCPFCTSIIDSIDGALPHITQRINFAVVSAAPIEEFRRHAERRGWRNPRLLSGAPGSYSRDYRAEDDAGNQWPLATVFVLRDGRIHHAWSSEMFFTGGDAGQDPRHVDFMWSVWAVLDRVPGGRGDFRPKLEY
jgi:predicted dithiol-disulfide oxidoreductase (DUF899 family)